MKRKAIIVLIYLALIAITMLTYRHVHLKEIYFNKGENHFKRDEYHQASEMYAKAIEKGLLTPIVFFRLSEVQLAVGDNTNALKTAKAFLQYQTEPLTPIVAFSDLFVYHGYFHEAAELLSEAIERDSENRSIRFNLAQTLVWTGQLEEAAEHFSILLETPIPAPESTTDQPAIEKQPLPAWQAQWELARVLSYMDEFDKSIEQYKDLLSTHPGLSKARAEMTTVYYLAGQQDNARKLLASAPPDKESEDKQTLSATSAPGAENINPEEAAQLYRKHLTSNPDDYKTRLKLAETLGLLGKYEEAIIEYRSILESHPGNLPAQYQYALVLSWSGNHKQAARQLSRINPPLP